MLAGRNARTARRTVLVTAVTAAFTIGAMGNALTAQANSNDALKQAQKKYKTAQNKCIKHHQLKQLPHILKLADEIKKLGGGKVKKKQLYKCLEFSVYFSDTLTLNGNSHSDGWTYTHNWNYNLFDFSNGEPLKPDFSSASRDDVESSGGLALGFISKGGATAKADGSPSCCSATQKGEGPKPKSAHGYAASVSIDPSAKDPRKTIELTLVLNTPLERYHTTYTGGGGGSSDETGQVWIYAYNFLHRNQKPAGLPPSIACSQTVFKMHGKTDGTRSVADRTLKSSGSMPLGTSRNSQDCAFFQGTNSIPDTSRYDPWMIPTLNASDETHVVLEHGPPKP